MKTYDVSRSCKIPSSYRAARVRSLFNVTPDQGSTFTLRAELPTDESDWRVGLIVGPSGSGKSTLAREAFGTDCEHSRFVWTRGPIIDQIGASVPFNDAVAALSAVGLGSCPSWLRPFDVLSVGEKFRAELARLLLEAGDRVWLDEFTSALDRKVARVAAHAFGKAWRRRAGQFVAVTCHGDVTDWLQPDWIFDAAKGTFARRLLRRRPEITIEVRQTNWSMWRLFEPHHYLKLPLMAGATNFVGYVEGEPIVHLAAAPTCGVKSVRFSRLVVMPEWQGAGVGMAFLNHMAERYFRGRNRYAKRMTSIIHTSHPGLAAALRRDERWVLTTARIGEKSDRAGKAGSRRHAAGHNVPTFGGHLRAVLGFRYIGDRT
ncbi:MAG: ABC transporter ATP-binding protein [Phycisphaerae bacterium]|nr:ABC transporter ATP-binding protein [Phycisphaerae bacterium]